MSVQMMGAVIACGPRDRAEYGVLLALANYADEFGFAWPSLATLAHDARYDERSTRRIVDELESQGWLHVGRKVLNAKSNVYILNLERIGVKVPGEARRSPLFLRLTKKHPDKMSPIFLPRESPDMAKFSEDNPQGVTGQNGGESPDKNRGVTGQAMSPKPSRTVTEPSRTTMLLRNSPTPLGEGCETEGQSKSAKHSEDPAEDEPPEPPVTIRRCGVDATAKWESLKTALARDLGGRMLPAAVSARFSPLTAKLGDTGPEIAPGRPSIREGMSDFDLCFSAWWLEEIRLIPGCKGYVFATEAFDEAATEAGLARYAGRIEKLVRAYFPVAPKATVRVELQRKPEQMAATGTGP